MYCDPHSRVLEGSERERLPAPSGLEVMAAYGGGLCRKVA